MKKSKLKAKKVRVKGEWPGDTKAAAFHNNNCLPSLKPLFMTFPDRWECSSCHLVIKR